MHLRVAWMSYRCSTVYMYLCTSRIGSSMPLSGRCSSKFKLRFFCVSLGKGAHTGEAPTPKPTRKLQALRSSLVSTPVHQHPRTQIHKLLTVSSVVALRLHLAVACRIVGMLAVECWMFLVGSCLLLYLCCFCCWGCYDSTSHVHYCNCFCLVACFTPLVLLAAVGMDLFSQALVARSATGQDLRPGSLPAILRRFALTTRRHILGLRECRVLG